MKVLLISQDIRNPTGLSAICRTLIEGIRDVEWVQLGCVSSSAKEDLKEETLVWKSDCCTTHTITVYAVSNHGSEVVFVNLIEKERPDVILFFDDPFRWRWLSLMNLNERKYKLIYYFVWDNLPDPLFIIPFLSLFDEIICISALTFGICNRLPLYDTRVSYVPHGVDGQKLFPFDESHAIDQEAVLKVKSEWSADEDAFIFLANNMNLGRKRLGCVLESFAGFCDSFSLSCNDVKLVIHSTATFPGGPNLGKLLQNCYPTLSDRVAIDYRIWDRSHINLMYNAADAVINIASSEGFGLATLEAITAGRPILASVTGGLQQQCGLEWKQPTKNDCRHVQEADYILHGTFSDPGFKEKLQWGSWAYPIWPSVTTTTGNDEFGVDYIWSEYVRCEDVASGFDYWFSMPTSERREKGNAGRAWALKNYSNQRMIDGIRKVLETFM